MTSHPTGVESAAPTASTAPGPLIDLPTTLPDGSPLRIAIDADCPRCGYPERFFEPGRGVFGCSSLNPNPCGYESTERKR